MVKEREPFKYERIQQRPTAIVSHHFRGNSVEDAAGLLGVTVLCWVEWVVMCAQHIPTGLVPHSQTQHNTKLLYPILPIHRKPPNLLPTRFLHLFPPP